LRVIGGLRSSGLPSRWNAWSLATSIMRTFGRGIEFETWVSGITGAGHR
jgi:hypothetical protein